MRQRNHIYLAILFVIFLALTTFIPLEMLPLALFAIAGAMVPDLDYYWGTHRKTFHNVWILIAMVAYFWFYKFPFWASYFFTVGFISHLIGDALTVTGIMPLYPIRWKMSGPIKNGTTFENICVVLIAIGLVALYLLTGGKQLWGW